MTIPTGDECSAKDMLAAPWRERRAWVNARNALLQTHLVDLHHELGQVVDDTMPPARALERITYLRAALDQVERRLQGLQAVAMRRPCVGSAWAPPIGMLIFSGYNVGTENQQVSV
jgi:hypothetical protein